ncbi:TonB-dependent siderophore receptor [Acinetobacter populi]|uniref:TonB-dependent siderophore receptor n=1 Tax=Acinetobacter populi TaxID=1582270 RepID=A0A1Z9YWA2_9GAMM|nr:TonB-dependent siderophore receptor [Acinetobacter populi]OUY06495.1 TonB-dependent siderophore receptor [Acinetobacter populi]
MKGSFARNRFHPLVIAISAVSANVAYAEDTSNIQTLPVITIEAEEDTSVTEGTGSYTAKSASTATKLNLSLRETPQTVKVLTQEYLEDRNLSSLQDVFNTITGVSTPRTDERQNVYARGFQVDYYLVDGMPSTTNMGSNDLDLGIYDRIEIIKGANGLTTGAGNPAMATNLIRKRANSKEFTGNLNTSYGSWNAWSTSADLSAPLNQDGSLRGRIYLKHSDEDSFMDSYHKERNVAYGTVDWDISDKTSAYLGATYQELNRSGVRWGGIPAFYTDGTRTNFSRSLTVSAPWTYWNQDDVMVFAGIKQNLFNDIKLNIAYTWRQTEMDTQLLNVGGQIDKATNTSAFSNTSVWKAQQENVENNIDIYLNAPFTLFNQPQEIIVGGSWNKNEATKYKYGGSYYAGGAASYLENPFSYTSGVGNLLKEIPWQPGSYLNQYPSNTTQSGFYLAGKFQLLDHLKTVAGVRLSNWKYESVTGSGNREFKNEVTPYFGVIYDVAQNHSLYASYTDIFKPQDKRKTDGNYLDPILGKQYETGLKSQWFDNRLNTAFSIFRIEQSNYAEKIDGVFVQNSSEQAYRGVDNVKSEGFEFEADGEINDNWSVNFGIANFEAKSQGVKVNTNNSRTSSNLFVKYKTGKWKAGAGVSYKSKYYNGTGVNYVEQKAVTLANAMLGYELDQNISIQANIENIFDKKYYEGVGTSVSYGEPRNATLTLRYKF